LSNLGKERGEMGKGGIGPPTFWLLPPLMGYNANTRTHFWPLLRHSLEKNLPSPLQQKSALTSRRCSWNKKPANDGIHRRAFRSIIDARVKKRSCWRRRQMPDRQKIQISRILVLCLSNTLSASCHGLTASSRPDGIKLISNPHALSPAHPAAAHHLQFAYLTTWGHCIGFHGWG